jgi:gas vesicle protein
MSDERHDAGGYMGWFLFGAMLGAAAAILLTPKTGAQARELLTERGGDVARRAQEIANEAQGRAGEWLDKSREVFEEQTQRLMSAFEAGRDAMREEIRKGGSSPSHG